MKTETILNILRSDRLLMWLYRVLVAVLIFNCYIEPALFPEQKVNYCSPYFMNECRELQAAPVTRLW